MIYTLFLPTTTNSGLLLWDSLKRQKTARDEIKKKCRQCALNGVIFYVICGFSRSFVECCTISISCNFLWCTSLQTVFAYRKNLKEQQNWKNLIKRKSEHTKSFSHSFSLCSFLTLSISQRNLTLQKRMSVPNYKTKRWESYAVSFFSHTQHNCIHKKAREKSWENFSFRKLCWK